MTLTLLKVKVTTHPLGKECYDGKVLQVSQVFDNTLIHHHRCGSLEKSLSNSITNVSTCGPQTDGQTEIFYLQMGQQSTSSH